MEKVYLRNLFFNVFKENEGLRFFFAPGRVNLIGEHTDYNGGLVFPCALSVGTYAVVKERDDDLVRLYSENFPEVGVVTFKLSQLEKNKEHEWANYCKGVLATMEKHGYKGSNGFDAVVYGNIPNGAGLSSSASIELVTAVLWDALQQFNVDRVKLVQYAQEAENDYIGVNCGIMDQFAISMGKEEHAILLDCNTLDYEYAPAKLNGVKLVIANTMKQRGLADSKYNERRAQCERAVAELNQSEEVSIDHLCSLTPAQFEAVQHHIADPVVLKRARHAVYENARTKLAVEKLNEGNVSGFGQLMNESHVSLRDDYEVTGKHLDALVEAAWEEDGVLGSRMTGAGFGGCTVSLIKEENLEEIVKRIEERYKQKTNVTPEFYIVNIGSGAAEF
ncbi:galactokinase [Evansella cellulosilytica]|uniref:Galactokinase n=1 Tax=Evansella cellulosilytica (strain ATCC 21833 / DSM 2522 / FERM P-1141 / JCM 9156 / N-4) TaxID=649639 RepID=E6TQD8_EVAC2|nr:galactokinase [Evansella cellulosilytica]ADU29316.1 galactokinase [Evansella cellulosilytica DSM 2522]